MDEELLLPGGPVFDLSDNNGGHWGQHPDHPVEDWQYEVANGDTRLGYWEWALKRLRERAEYDDGDDD